MIAAPAPKLNLFDLDRAGWVALFVELGQKPYRAQQVLKWIYHHRITDFEQMSDIGRELRAQLSERVEVRLPSLAPARAAHDGTIKWQVQLAAGGSVEAVYIPEAARATLCISSQVGCALACSFCSTGTQGFNRNLTTAEIIGQVWLAAGEVGHQVHGARKLTNIVFMGMGEPLLNFEALRPALSLLVDDCAFGFAARRVTVSTAGLVPGIDRLAAETDCALAVSLHAPDDALRSSLVPLNRKYPIADLLEACKRFLATRPRASITFEYTLLDGINDQPEHARALVKLLRKLPSKLNLIPFNPFPGTGYKRPDPEKILAFQRLIAAGGELATVRKTRGDDIDAACGQLVGRVEDRTRRQARHRAQLVAGAPS